MTKQWDLETINKALSKPKAPSLAKDMGSKPGASETTFEYGLTGSKEILEELKEMVMKDAPKKGVVVSPLVVTEEGGKVRVTVRVRGTHGI